MSRVQLVGGPLDGHEINAPSGRFAWVKGTRGGWRERMGMALLRFSQWDGGAASSDPKDGRALYDLATASTGVALYAGHKTNLCPGCGAFHGTVEGGSERRRCPLGGTTTV